MHSQSSGTVLEFLRILNGTWTSRDVEKRREQAEEEEEREAEQQPGRPAVAHADGVVFLHHLRHYRSLREDDGVQRHMLGRCSRAEGSVRSLMVAIREQMWLQGVLASSSSGRLRQRAALLSDENPKGSLDLYFCSPTLRSLAEGELDEHLSLFGKAVRQRYAQRKRQCPMTVLLYDQHLALFRRLTLPEPNGKVAKSAAKDAAAPSSPSAAENEDAQLFDGPLRRRLRRWCTSWGWRVSWSQLIWPPLCITNLEVSHVPAPAPLVPLPAAAPAAVRLPPATPRLRPLRAPSLCLSDPGTARDEPEDEDHDHEDAEEHEPESDQREDREEREEQDDLRAQEEQEDQEARARSQESIQIPVSLLYPSSAGTTAPLSSSAIALTAPPPRCCCIQ